MSALYIPGNPSLYFPVHKYHGIPLYRNIRQPADWKPKGYVSMDGHAYRGVVVELLTPEHLWETLQKEAEDIIKVNGEFIKDDLARNRCINAAYAKLWLADHRFQWAGLAAFASKQVGCGLLHANRLSEQSARDKKAAVHIAGNSSEAAGMNIGPAVIDAGAKFMLERLGYGNKCLFLDIYPLHRFYMERGYEKLLRCLPFRRNIKDWVSWDARDRLEFGKPFSEIAIGFGLINEGKLTGSVLSLAQHEQVNILQTILYDDVLMQRALAVNQFAWASGFPTGIHMEIQLTLSAQCKPKDGITSSFPRLRTAKLWVAEERMRFVNRAASRFDELLRSKARPQVERSIRLIASGGGIW